MSKVIDKLRSVVAQLPGVLSSVVKLVEAAPEVLPAASLATTEAEYVVLAVKPVKFADVLAVDPTTLPFNEIS